MKYSVIVVTSLVAFLLFAGIAFAGPPLDGIYQSADIDPLGEVELGRYSESWDTGGGALLPGTTLNAESWDGADLGLQWRYYCGTIVSAPVLIFDNVNGSGTGNRTYEKAFVGGYIWLSGSGPWANGDPDYPGVIIDYTEWETITYVAWEPVAAVTNVQATAQFDNYPLECMYFAIGNGSEVGTTDDGDTKPADYPDFLQQTTCDPVMTLGAWWNMFTLTMTITGCTNPTEETTWGEVKSLYNE